MYRKQHWFKILIFSLVFMFSLSSVAIAFGPGGGGGGGGGGSRSGPSGGGSAPSGGGSMPSGGGSMPSGGGTMPSGGAMPGTMPSGGSMPGTMPSGGSMPGTMPSGGSMPGTMPSGGSMPGGMPSGSFGGADIFSMGGLPGGEMPGGATPGFIPGSLVKIPEGISLNEIGENFDPTKFGITLPEGVSPDAFGNMLQGEGSFDFATQDLIKGLNPGKFGPMSNPYGISQAAGTFMDGSGKEQFGDFLTSASEGQPGHDWIKRANDLEAEGKYQEAIAVLSDPEAPFANIEGAPPLLYKEILEAKAAGEIPAEGTGTEKSPEGVVMKNLGAFLEAATEGSPGGKYIAEARSYESNGEYSKAASILKEQLKEHPDALVSAYVAELDAKAGNKVGSVKNIENAIAMAPDNASLYEKAGELYSEAGEKGPKIFVNGVKPGFDVKPQVQDGRTIVPFRALSESMGAQVNWNEETKTITMVKNDTQIEMVIGEKTARVDGKSVTLDVPPQIVDGRTLVPLRFVGEGLDTEVDYDQSSGIIKVMPKE